MPTDSGQDAPIHAESPAIKPAQYFDGAQQAIDAVKNDGAVSVWEDFAIDEMHPKFIALFDPDAAERFAQTVTALRSLPPAEDEFDSIIEAEGLEGELRSLVPQYSWGIPETVYKGGEWVIDPERLLDNEWDVKQMDEDYEWFEAQREGFRRMDEGEGVTSADEPWRAELQAKAIEIAKQDGRGHPEEADFNTAQILMGDRVPKKEQDRLQRDLQAIEEGRSSGNY